MSHFLNLMLKDFIMAKCEIAQFGVSNIVTGAARQPYLDTTITVIDSSLNQSKMVVEDTAPCAIQGLVVLQNLEDKNRSFGFIMNDGEKAFAFILGSGERNGSESFKLYMQKYKELEENLSEASGGFKAGMAISLSPKVAKAAQLAAEKISASFITFQGKEAKTLLKEKEIDETIKTKVTDDGEFIVYYDEAAIVATIEVMSSCTVAFFNFLAVVKTMGIFNGFETKAKELKKKIALRCRAIKNASKD